MIIYTKDDYKDAVQKCNCAFCDGKNKIYNYIQDHLISIRSQNSISASQSELNYIEILSGEAGASTRGMLFVGKVLCAFCMPSTPPKGESKGKPKSKTKAASNPKAGAKAKPKRLPQQAFLVAVQPRQEPTRVYALLAATIEEALIKVRSLAADDIEVEPAGMLSRQMARSLKLKPGEMRLV